MLNPQASAFSLGDSADDGFQHRNMSPVKKGGMRVYVDAAANNGRESTTIRVSKPPSLSKMLHHNLLIHLL